MNIYKHSIILVFCLLVSSCSHIVKKVSTPVYSSHTNDTIILSKTEEQKKIYIKESAGDHYGIYAKVVKELKQQFKQMENIEIVDKQNMANYILALNIRNIAVDIDYDFANNMRNSLLSNEIKPEYLFDANNNPHINNDVILSLVDKNKSRYMRRRLTPSLLYTLIGFGGGFTFGYLLAGATAPIAFGFLGGLVIGGTTYFIYNSVRKVGVIVSYDIIIEEKIKQSVHHNKKNLIKLSSNVADETYYLYSNNTITHSSKNIVIATGSRVLIDDMISNVCPIISKSILMPFN